MDSRERLELRSLGDKELHNRRKRARRSLLIVSALTGVSTLFGLLETAVNYTSVETHSSVSFLTTLTAIIFASSVLVGSYGINLSRVYLQAIKSEMQRRKTL